MMEIRFGHFRVLLSNSSLICLILVRNFHYPVVLNSFHGFLLRYLFWISSVWEVRHGSVMAMREILTHQGANAGVIIPDLSCDSALNIKIKERVNENTVKRERPIDLNMQVPPDELESVSKKLKVEPEDAAFLPMDTMVCTSTDGDPGGVSVKVEDVGLSLAVDQTNGEVSSGSVKFETQSHLSGGILGNDMSDEKRVGVDKTPMEKMGVLENLPENCELMNLVRLARHSWLKNCEFLQDCAIRFLCVLSLERYGFSSLGLISFEYSFQFPHPKKFKIKRKMNTPSVTI